MFNDCNQSIDQTLQDFSHSEMTLKSIEDFIDMKLSQTYTEENEGPANRALTGRLGPKTVIMDVCSNIGRSLPNAVLWSPIKLILNLILSFSLVIESDRLSLLSHSGFSSIKANVCVFRVCIENISIDLRVIEWYLGEVAIWGHAQQ